jgi:Helix-turn-helix domain
MELRRQRMAAGLSLARLAALVHYHKSYLSRIETGGKPPTRDLALRCEAVLGCAGQLASLVPALPRPAAPGADEANVWMLSLAMDSSGNFSLVTPASSRPPSSVPAGPVAIASFTAMYDQLRQLSHCMAPQVLLGMLLAPTQALCTGARESRSSDRDQALSLAAYYAEYAGWIAQEAGDDTRALWLTELAVRLATDAGDQEMAAYGLVRRGLLAMYRGDAAGTIEPAWRARVTTRSPRVAGLAAQRQAQGHALAGDYESCRRALDAAAGLLAKPVPPRAGPTLGTVNVADPAAMALGWCLVDLGRPATAVPVLRRELAKIPAGAHRSRARFGTRLAVALAESGEPEEACAVAGPALESFERTYSATTRGDLRRLARALDRRSLRGETTETRLRLTRALHAS